MTKIQSWSSTPFPCLKQTIEKNQGIIYTFYYTKAINTTP